jgi:hypothetical protein
MGAEDFEQMTVSALRDRLLEFGDKPPVKMRKAELIQKLEVCNCSLPSFGTSLSENAQFSPWIYLETPCLHDGD